MRRKNLPAGVKHKILAEADERCFYCGKHATEIDHVVPWCESHDDSESNLVACCERCNGRAGAKKFESMDNKRAFLSGLVEQLKRDDLWTFGGQFIWMMKNSHHAYEETVAELGIDRAHFDAVIRDIERPTREDCDKIRRVLGWHFDYMDYRR